MSQFDRTIDSHAGADRDGDVEFVARTEVEMAPANVFSILGNDTRVDILRALLELSANDEPVSFTDLFERIDVDDSANFSYHLRKLTGHFIKKHDGGYEFRYPGRKVVSSIFAGTLTDRAQLGFFPASGSCYACGSGLQGWYVDDTLTIGCTDCGTIQVSYPFPSGGLNDRTADELLQAFHHYVRHHYCLAADGVCPECSGIVKTSLVRNPNENLDIAVEHACDRCGYHLQSTVGIMLLDNADVLVFHSKRGVDLNTEPFWHFDWCVSDEQTTVVSEDPLRIQLTLSCKGDQLRILLDENGDIVETAIVEELLPSRASTQATE